MEDGDNAEASLTSSPLDAGESKPQNSSCQPITEDSVSKEMAAGEGIRLLYLFKKRVQPSKLKDQRSALSSDEEKCYRFLAIISAT
jgi:hypothetical protein